MNGSRCTGIRALRLEDLRTDAASDVTFLDTFIPFIHTKLYSTLMDKFYLRIVHNLDF